MNLHDFADTLRTFLASTDDWLWVSDERVYWDGLENEFKRDFLSCDTDFLGTAVRSYAEDRSWYWWPHLKPPVAFDPHTHGVAALLPLVRFSRRAAEVIVKGIDSGWQGHPEAVIPTLVNIAGMKIEDIGGIGSFTPTARKNQWYDSRTWDWRGPVEYHPGRLHFPLATLYHAIPTEKLAPQPHVTFMFLTRGELHHEEIWSDYLKDGGSMVRLMAHTKDLSRLTSNSMLRAAQITARVPTSWGGISLVHATIELLKAALADGWGSHFVLVSESCVPVRPFSHFVLNLRRDDRSRIRFWSPSDLWNSGQGAKAMRANELAGISHECIFFQEQWMCLNREDAEIVTSKDWTPSFKRVHIPDECYFATVLAAAGKPVREAVANRSITWSEWQSGSSHPQEFRRVPRWIAAQIAESGSYFARKFPTGSDIGTWRMHSEVSAVESSISQMR